MSKWKADPKNADFLVMSEAEFAEDVYRLFTAVDTAAGNRSVGPMSDDYRWDNAMSRLINLTDREHADMPSYLNPRTAKHVSDALDALGKAANALEDAWSRSVESDVRTATRRAFGD